VVVGDAFEFARVVDEESRAFDPVDGPVSFDEVVADGEDIVDDYQSNLVFVQLLLQIQKDLVVVVQITHLHQVYAVPDSLLTHRDCRALRTEFGTLSKEDVLHLTESLLVQMLASHDIQRRRVQPPVLLRQDGIQQELNRKLGFPGARLSIDFVDAAGEETSTEEVIQDFAAGG